jgi:vacuolar-type H+-ATPase subunit I/STV1
MPNHPFPENAQELHELKNHLKDLQAEWLETLDDLAKAKEETKNGNLFAILDYLTFCDHLSKAIYLDLKEVDAQLNSLKRMKNHVQQHKLSLDLAEEFLTEMEELRNQMEKKIQNIDSEYSILAETALQQSQDFITKFAEAIQTEKVVPNLRTDINQNLEKELFLQALRDTLEAYRQAREEFISEVEMNNIQRLPEDRIPEDIGEEKPEMDAILSQLDTAISACDLALLRKEIGD